MKQDQNFHWTIYVPKSRIIFHTNVNMSAQQLHIPVVLQELEKEAIFIHNF